MSGCPEAAQGPERVVICHYNGQTFSNRHLPREHLRIEREKLSPKLPTLKLYAQSCWTGAATLLRPVMQKRESITTVVLKAKQKVLDMDFETTFFEAAMAVST
jgi:hypothetical protein